MKKLIFLFFIIIGILFYKYSLKQSSNSHFTVTADTNVSQVAFRYWDIDHNYTKNRNPLMLKLKATLKSKDTKKVLDFLKDHNLSIDVNIEDKTTPLMYSSFYNDLNTSKELIKLGANPHAKDRYGLSALAYAIENNSTKTAKLLVDNGVRFEEVKQVQCYLRPSYYSSIKQLVINNDKIKIIYKNNWQKNTNSKDESDILHYIVGNNYIQLAKMAFESGYKPKLLNFKIGVPGLERHKDKNASIFRSVYPHLSYMPNYKPMLELLLKHNVVGGEIEEKELKRAYDECYDDYISFLDVKAQFENGDINLTIKEQSRLKRTISYHRESCSEKNATFKGIKEFFKYSNELKKNTSIGYFLDRNKNKPNKIIYINETIK